MSRGLAREDSVMANIRLKIVDCVGNVSYINGPFISVEHALMVADYVESSCTVTVEIV